MSMVSVRIPEDLEARLDAEARLAGRPRSDMVREAVTEYLARRERERRLEEMAGEMRRAYADKDLAEEAREIETADLEQWADALAREESAAAPGEKWWS
jgi:metal-responsive CopG/Arc/MetJ family transcriptional regulator